MAAGRHCTTAHGIRPAGGLLSFWPDSAPLVALFLLPLAACEAPSGGASPSTVATESGDPGNPDREGTLLDPEQIDRQTQLGLSVLQAKGAAHLLGQASVLRSPLGPVTFGDRLALAIEIRNPFPEEVEILQPEGGFGLEFRFRVERFFPDGGRETTSQTRVVRLDASIQLGPGESFRRELDFELDPGDPASALWQLELGLSMRVAGLRVGGRSLPLAEFGLRPVRLLALPDGWQELAEDPLARLEQAAGLDSPLADRHLLVCAVLLPADQRQAAVRVLAEALPRSPSDGRAVTIAAALDRLTGLGFGASPQRWIEWWASRQNEGP